MADSGHASAFSRYSTVVDFVAVATSLYFLHVFVRGNSSDFRVKRRSNRPPSHHYLIPKTLLYLISKLKARMRGGLKSASNLGIADSGSERQILLCAARDETDTDQQKNSTLYWPPVSSVLVQKYGPVTIRAQVASFAIKYTKVRVKRFRLAHGKNDQHEKQTSAAIFGGYAKNSPEFESGLDPRSHTAASAAFSCRIGTNFRHSSQQHIHYRRRAVAKRFNS